MPDGEQEGGDGMSAENNGTWPPSMDAVVAAPESHRVLFENDDVRVLEVTIAAGHREPEHTHRDPSVMIVDGPARIRYYQGDTLTFSSPADTVSAGTRASWMAPEDPHSVENVDDHPYHAIRVELRTHGRARPPRLCGCVRRR
jgi:hypothetical protein